MKGICYAPVPVRSRHGPRITDDDFFGATTSAFWGSDGRGDMSIMRSLGANAVRLYGDDPRLDHRPFLDEAYKQELSAIVGISDYPYIQMRGNCRETGYDCYDQIKRQYGDNLRRGFLMANSTRYHPALHTVILMNEPDLKFTDPYQYCKVIVSAFDAVLDAEKEFGVLGPAPNFTATFSFGICPRCQRFQRRPSLGQMHALREAMRDPSSVGYVPHNDIWFNYVTRFVNSINTANSFLDLRRMFLGIYDNEFQGTPVFVGEYHAPNYADQASDIAGALSLAANASSMLTGISFFEFQVRYDKGGSEMDFGMFGLSESESVAPVTLNYNDFKAWCLTPVSERGTWHLPGRYEPVRFLSRSSSPLYLHDDVANAFGGPGVTADQLCPQITATITTTARSTDPAPTTTTVTETLQEATTWPRNHTRAPSELVAPRSSAWGIFGGLHRRSAPQADRRAPSRGLPLAAAFHDAAVGAAGAPRNPWKGFPKISPLPAPDASELDISGGEQS